MTFSEQLLPPYFKIIGLVLALVTLLLFLWDLEIAIFLNLEPDRVQWILKDCILLGLAFVVFSKERIYLPNLKKLRDREMKTALAFGIFLVLWESIQEIMIWNESYEPDSGIEILTAVLIYYLVFFTYHKSKIRPEKLKMRRSQIQRKP